MKVNVNGVWKSGTPHVNVNGTWKKASSAWINISGVWKRFWEDYIEPWFGVCDKYFNISGTNVSRSYDTAITRGGEYAYIRTGDSKGKLYKLRHNAAPIEITAFPVSATLSYPRIAYLPNHNCILVSGTNNDKVYVYDISKNTTKIIPIESGARAVYIDTDWDTGRVVYLQGSSPYRWYLGEIDFDNWIFKKVGILANSEVMSTSFRVIYSKTHVYAVQNGTTSAIKFYKFDNAGKFILMNAYTGVSSTGFPIMSAKQIQAVVTVGGKDFIYFPVDTLDFTSILSMDMSRTGNHTKKEFHKVIKRIGLGSICISRDGLNVITGSGNSTTSFMMHHWKRAALSSIGTISATASSNNYGACAAVAGNGRAIATQKSSGEYFVACVKSTIPTE